MNLQAKQELNLYLFGLELLLYSVLQEHLTCLHFYRHDTLFVFLG